MLLAILLFAAPLLPPQTPTLVAPVDTTRLVRGFMNQQFAWGTLVLRDGRRLQGYLPAAAATSGQVVAYYAQPPDAKPAPRPKLLIVDKVRWLRVQGHYAELLPLGKGEQAQLAVRRQTGAVELFVVLATEVPPVTSFLGSTPVLAQPAASPADLAGAAWYLRRPGGPLQLIAPQAFATQVAAFLADDKVLAAKVAAGATGYGFADLENIVQQYNRHAP